MPACRLGQTMVSADNLWPRAESRRTRLAFRLACKVLPRSRRSFWRLEPNVDMSDQIEAEWLKGFALYSAFDHDAGVGRGG